MRNQPSSEAVILCVMVYGKRKLRYVQSFNLAALATTHCTLPSHLITSHPIKIREAAIE